VWKKGSRAFRDPGPLHTPLGNPAKSLMANALADRTQESAIRSVPASFRDF
jgi:hypothetical protein